MRAEWYSRGVMPNKLSVEAFLLQGLAWKPPLFHGFCLSSWPSSSPTVCVANLGSQFGGSPKHEIKDFFHFQNTQFYVLQSYEATCAQWATGLRLRQQKLAAKLGK
ncbi:hypothetical protein BaRGS_00007770 [Batillaria attramentaria]|uniref:Uncharacterized protein n=1 Tax=Batillaria attramentaria TaxID=370345 RepID=A0ABD0LN69_9CAEN